MKSDAEFVCLGREVLMALIGAENECEDEKVSCHLCACDGVRKGGRKEGRKEGEQWMYESARCGIGVPRAFTPQI